MPERGTVAVLLGHDGTLSQAAAGLGHQPLERRVAEALAQAQGDVEAVYQQRFVQHVLDVARQQAGADQVVRAHRDDTQGLAAGGFDLGGLTWRLAPFVEGEGSPSSTDLVLDHVVVRTGDAERAAADLGARVGLDLRLDRRLTEHGFRGLFFRCGDAVVEVAAPIEPTGEPDSFGGLAWRSADIEATRERLVAGGVEVSEVRTGRKPGTRVATVRDRALGTSTLVIEQG